MTAQDVLDRLAAATCAQVSVRQGSAGTGGQGEGRADATLDGRSVEVSEAGEWAYGDAPPMRWRVVSRWTAQGDALAVEHTRQGAPAQAVLDRQPDGRWLARAPHRCGEDLYDAELVADEDAVAVTWTISGPCKSAQITTRYR